MVRAMKSVTLEDFKRWGSMGGKARKKPRILTREQAISMVQAREAKKNGLKVSTQPATA
jgi:hypothetical protein